MVDLKSFSDLKNHILSNVENNGDEIIFTLKNGEKYKLTHFQNCCENVRVEDICGDLEDLINAEIFYAEESVNDKKPFSDESYSNHGTWTFYLIGTSKGSVTIRFLGESNGYYSESVDFVKC